MAGFDIPIGLPLSV